MVQAAGSPNQETMDHGGECWRVNWLVGRRIHCPLPRLDAATPARPQAHLTRSLPPLAELVKVVELDEGVYQREYKNGLVYLFGNGPWVGCVPPPVPKPEQYYFKVWFDTMLMTVIVKESGLTQTVNIVLEGKDGALTGAAPGFRASLSMTGRRRDRDYRRIRTVGFHDHHHQRPGGEHKARFG